jgi:hypothetical protein
MATVRCFSCGEENSIPGNVGLRAECHKCSSDLHVCKCCIHWDPKVYNECKEPQADIVKDRERANFCDHYNPTCQAGITGPAKSDLLAAAEALFKKK